MQIKEGDGMMIKRTGSIQAHLENILLRSLMKASKAMEQKTPNYHPSEMLHSEGHFGNNLGLKLGTHARLW